MIVEHLLNNSDATLVNMSSLKCGYINPKSQIGIRLMPSHFIGEGQYICQIRKPGNSSTTTFKSEKKKVGDFEFLVESSINLPMANIYRYGVKIGENRKGNFRYDLHYARTLKAIDMDSVELNLDELKKYLAGEQLNKSNPYKGFVLLTYKNNAVDIAKSDTRVIKNYYPKGLRKKF